MNSMFNISFSCITSGITEIKDIGKEKLSSSRGQFTADIVDSLTDRVNLVKTAANDMFKKISFQSGKLLRDGRYFFSRSVLSVRAFISNHFVNKKKEMIPQAPLSSRLFMIIRELPRYFFTAYSLRYKEIEPETGILAPIKGRINRSIELIREIVTVSPGKKAMIDRNIDRLNTSFKELNRELDKTNRAICVYFVSGWGDHNGAILGNSLYYYHHYKIAQFKQHFDVFAKVVAPEEDVCTLLDQLKMNYPNRSIKVVDIVAHGSERGISIGGLTYRDDVVDDGFKACDPDAAIILDACSAGERKGSVAEVISKKNPGKKVFAPGTWLFFSKPLFKTEGNMTRIDHVVHGFAVLYAYTSRLFHIEKSA